MKNFPIPEDLKNDSNNEENSVNDEEICGEGSKTGIPKFECETASKSKLVQIKIKKSYNNIKRSIDNKKN